MLTGIYLLVVNVVLINLLIAMMGRTYSMVQEDSLQVWHLQVRAGVAGCGAQWAVPGGAATACCGEFNAVRVLTYGCNLPPLSVALFFFLHVSLFSHVVYFFYQKLRLLKIFKF